MRGSSVGQQSSSIGATGRRRILVVEDEPAIAGFVRRGLVFEGYAVDMADDGPAALACLREGQPDLLILDVMLPGIDGLEVARRVRSVENESDRAPLPILMLTARDAVPDRIAGLDAGADDYLVKPFDFDELLARVRALLRRGQSPRAARCSRYADLELDLTARTVVRGSRPVTLTAREFDLLALFMRHPNHVLTRRQLMDRIWGDDYFGDSNVLEVFVANLRRALEAAAEPRLIQTVRGVGYVLRESAER
ncbi:MAG: response regulator transcription factor [Thermomicrobiales bacterium]|nr:response regulator transcription factor [Thermomicrobiales bacterium]